jgi:hypothetical protein
MKYLKIFENNDNIIDRDYIEICFVEFMYDDNFAYWTNYDKKNM